MEISASTSKSARAPCHCHDVWNNIIETLDCEGGSIRAKTGHPRSDGSQPKNNFE